MRLLDWLEDRTGYKKVVHEALDEPVPGGARWAYVWGSALTLSFVVQAVTGWLLMTAYQPSAATAWSSVWYIQNKLSWGWLVRGLHHYGAQAMVILLAAHLGQTALYGAYKKPREVNWLLGLGLMAITLGFALTGYLLPWDQKGYWATRVATNIAASMPLVGHSLQRLLVGGDEYGHLTLTRFYSLHVGLLPVALIALLAAHVALFRKHGVTPPADADEKKVDRFYPKQVGKDLLVAGVILVALFFLAIRDHGAPLDAPADAASDYPARPEWYFLALFELLKHVPGRLEWVAAAGIPLVLGGYLVALPFLDRGPSKRARHRLALLAPLGVILAGAAGLTWMSMSSDRADNSFVAARAKAEERATRAAQLAANGVPPDGPLAMLAADPDTRGPELFARHCAGCHRLGEMGPSPEKAAAPDLTGWGSRAWVGALLDDPDAAHLFGKTPFKGMMDSFTRPPKDPALAEGFKPLAANESDAIAAFLEGQARGEDGKGSAGEKLVKAKCTGCHRLDGQDPLDPESLAPELRGWASLAWIRAQIANPGSGKTYPPGAIADKLEGHMPAFEKELEPAEIDLLARWLAKAALASAGGTTPASVKR
jgi:ubiquinol-cytochrome c reductase cytochrome b subunit